MGLIFLIWSILEATAEIFQKFRLLFGRFEGTKKSFWNYLTFINKKADFWKLDWFLRNNMVKWILNLALL